MSLQLIRITFPSVFAYIVIIGVKLSCLIAVRPWFRIHSEVSSLYFPCFVLLLHRESFTRHKTPNLPCQSQQEEKALKTFKLTFTLNYCSETLSELPWLSGCAQSENVFVFIWFFAGRMFVIGFSFDRRPLGAILGERTENPSLAICWCASGCDEAIALPFPYFFILACPQTNGEYF